MAGTSFSGTSTSSGRKRLLAIVSALLALGVAGCGQHAAVPRQILFLSDRDGSWALYAMDTHGGNQRRLLAAGQVDPFGETVGFGEPVVSPDGTKVLLARRGVTVVTLATGTSKRLGAGEESSAAWSPDGKHVVFSGREGNGLYLADVDGGRTRTLLRRSFTATPAWSPDGKWIAFVRQIGDGPLETDLVNPDGTGLRRLSRYAPDRNLSWSRDGKLAFIGGRGDESLSHLVVIHVRSRRVRVARSRLAGGTVAWSPDGRTIAYSAANGLSDAAAIYTVDADGGGRRALTPPHRPYYDQSPVWSPDGKSLVFVRAPFGGGAEREVREVWTMHSDGSHQRRLTDPYPDGGDNAEPAWIRGAARTEPAPLTRELRRGEAVVLRVRFPVDGIAAEGAHAAIAPVAYEEQRDFKPTPPILVWRPGRGEPTRIAASPCGGIQQLVMTRSRLAFDCDQRFFDEIGQSVWVVDLRTRVPREVFLGEGGPGPSGILLDNIVGGGGLLAFGSERRDAHGRVRLRTVWGIEGFDSVALRSRPNTGDVLAAGHGRLAVELADGRVAILRADGTLLRVLPLARRRTEGDPFGFDRKPPFLLAGRELLLLEHGTLRAYDAATGKLQWERGVPAGAQLEAADRQLVVYTEGRSVHVVSRGNERVIRTGARQLRRFGVERLVHAALTPDGLFYCFDVADRRYPGRVVFVPRRALPEWQRHS
jgi:Tol biopolymer transport system component